MKNKIFNHLHVHSIYSSLDGFGKVNAICLKAKEIGSTAIAITDHAKVSAFTDLIKYAKESEIKPIIGCEFYMVESLEQIKDQKRLHLSVWAKNFDGFKKIMLALSLANKQFYKRPIITFEQALDFGKDVIIATACSHGLLRAGSYFNLAAKFKEVYGEDFYLEIMPFSIIENEVDIQKEINDRAIELSANLGIKLVATNDCHYINKEDSKKQEVLLAIQTNATWDSPTRFRFETDGLYLKSYDEMASSFADLDYIPEDIYFAAMDATVEISEKINLEMPKFDIHLPSPYNGDEHSDLMKFKELIELGWRKKRALFDPSIPITTYKERLLFEVNVILNLKFSNYFLVVEDIIRVARSNGIMVGSGRGSAAGSLVCFLLDITQVDPLRFGLYFERFLNPERIDFPDIDVDFQDSRRSEVFDYIRNKYGEEYTANINNYTFLKLKSAFRDVCRVFGIPVTTVNILSKQIDDEADVFEVTPDLINFNEQYPQIIPLVKELAGVVRNNGQHACGYIVSSQKIEELAAIERRKEGEVINWNSKQAEQFGLVKIDILGLTTLTVLSEAKALIKERHGVDIDYIQISLEDEKTLDSFSKGHGVGVFQFENKGMAGLLRALQANSFSAITDTTALHRPGSLQSGQTETYVKVAKGEILESYLTPELKPILRPTNGVMVYQEQLMQIFNQLAGFTWAESDTMRKIIGKKLGKEEFEKHREHFVNGCLQNGIAPNISELIFNNMTEFASYSFNKSHAVAYSMISFWSMYIKIHYPAEFMAALLSSADDDKMQIYVLEAKRLGIRVNLPDINLSTDKFRVISDDEIIAPLSCIKGVGEKAVAAILEGRRKPAGDFYLNFDDFISSVQKRVVNKRVVDNLTKAGALESFGIGEPIPDLRAKNFAEKIPFYNELPVISLKSGNKLSKASIEQLILDYHSCCKEKSVGSFIPPLVLGVAPVIMVIAMPIARETKHCKNAGTSLMLDKLKEVGVPNSAIYYTSPFKCNIKEPPKECLSKCHEALKAEIGLIKPKLIICTTPHAFSLFGIKGTAMSKEHGSVIFSPTFDCYVAFSYSSQYAYFQPDKGLAPFEEAIEKIGNIFN